MAAGERPAVVLVLAVLNVVVGTVGVLATAVGGVLLSSYVSLMSNTYRAPEDTSPFHLPEFARVVLCVSAVWSAVFVVWVVAGFGLLQLRPWSRWLCGFAAGLTLLVLGMVGPHSLLALVPAAYSVASVAVLFLPRVAVGFGRPAKSRARDEATGD